MRISDWSSGVCSSDLGGARAAGAARAGAGGEAGAAGAAAVRGRVRPRDPAPNPSPEGEGGIRFAGYAAVFDRVDRGGDVVRGGAFAASLRARRAVPTLWQHRSGAVVGIRENLEDGRASVGERGGQEGENT